MNTQQMGCCPHVTRRSFLGGVGAAIGGSTLRLPSWPVLARETEGFSATARAPLTVKPILIYETPQRRSQASWRNWGGIQTEEQASQEATRIQEELKRLQQSADFPLTLLSVASIKDDAGLDRQAEDLAKAQAVLVYGAGGPKRLYDRIGTCGKDVIIFVRHKSGPVYLWYEIISPRYLRQHTDELSTPRVDFDDIVVDSPDELLWRLRALCGLHNSRGSRIIAIGGPSAWAQPEGLVPDLVRKLWKLDFETVSYDDLGKLIEDARSDQATVVRAGKRSEDYLRLPGTKLETQAEFVHNAFLLEEVFRTLLDRMNARAITVNSCMGTIMPVSRTTACLTLSLLNDAGYLAFCESDFVVIPSGLLLGNISGKPVFLNDPTYPHDGLITLAHCTAPRKNDGRSLDPARIMTHFESDYGAAPKVEMKIGQVVTNIIPDFRSERWVGFIGTVVDNPNMDICRSQIDVRFSCDSGLVARNMPGFHWMTCYGDYMRELGYALKKIPIKWERLA
ncbi:MAG TPA: sugar isomerase [Acidobacteriota bacterium]|nr:sugar isomerase [Acidobacteriota bacterium]